MTQQFDFIGDLPPARAFKDITNTRPSAAEEKAALCLELGRLCHKVPPSVAQGSVEKTRAWTTAQTASMKLVNSKRPSVPMLTAAIRNMRAFL